MSIYEKLSEFQKYVGKIRKDKNNPFHKSKYADINTVLEAVQEPLSIVGLVMFQSPITREDGSIVLNTVISEIDGEGVITSSTPLLLGKQEMQPLGSAITYARRYALVSMLGLEQDDDDGAGSRGGFIKPADIKAVKELILKTKTNQTSFLAYYKATQIKDIRDFQVRDVIEKLESKLNDRDN